MKLKRTLLVGATLATVTLGGGGLAMAATDTSSDTSDGTSLVEKIASKFNLKQADVQAVFDTDRAEHKAEMQADQKERLAQAVTDGDITQAQADHITSALAEIDTLMGDTKPDEQDDTVRDQIKAKMDALRTWADDNDVDMKFIGHGGHGGPGGPGGFGGGPRDDDGDDDSSSSSSDTSDSSSGS